MASSGSSSSSPAVSDPSEFTLISSDNRRFFIPSTASALSGVIKHGLQNKAWPENAVVLEKYTGKALEPVAEYLRGNGRASHDGEMKRRFDREFLSAPGSVDAVFSAALDLEIPGLVELVSEKLSDDVSNVDSRILDWVNRPFQGDLGTSSSSSDEELIEGAQQLPILRRGNPGQGSSAAAPRRRPASFTCSSSSEEDEDRFKFD